MALPTLMLKTTRLSNKPAPSKDDNSKSASSKNNNSKPTFKKNDGNGEVDRFGDNGMEHAKKLGKSKGEKLAKSQKLSKSKGEKSKKTAKSRNSPNFGATESRPSFLTPEARAAFNRLRLAFIRAPIFRYFNSECHIWIETDTLGYAIDDMLN